MQYCISDIHGNYEKYLAILEIIDFRPDDTLYVLGDVIDRGPDGVKILRDMMLRPNVIPLLGNHEFAAALCLRWLLKEVTDESLAALDGAQVVGLREWVANGGAPTLQALAKLSPAEREDVLDYIGDMELYAEVTADGKDYVLVHAGLGNFHPDKPLENYEPEDFLFARPDPTQSGYPNKTLVFGHTPTRLLREAAGEAVRDDIFRRDGLLAIDCGCGFGGRLGAVCLETGEEFYA